MKYLGTPGANPIMLWVVARCLKHAGPADESALFASLRPSGFGFGESEGAAVTETLKVGRNLGMFLETDDARPKYALSEPFESHDAWMDDFSGFATEARRLLVQQFDDPVGEPSDVATGLAWLLAQDWRRPVNPLDVQTRHEAIANTTQATPFRRWCEDLGFAQRGLLRKGGVGQYHLLVDPTVALRDAVGSLSVGEHPAEAFAEHLRETIPFGLGPTEESTTDPDTGALPGSVAYGLTRLELEGRLKLVQRDDARAPMLVLDLDSGAYRRVAAVGVLA